MKILMLGEQGTGKPLFARIVANILQNESRKTVHIRDLEMHDFKEDSEHTIYTLDSLDPNNLPQKPVEFFDLVIMIPNEYDETMKSIKHFSPTIHRVIEDAMTNEIRKANPVMFKENSQPFKAY